MKKLMLASLITLIFLCTCLVLFAKRAEPEPVNKTVNNGIEYRAPHNLIGCVEAWHIAKGIRLWWKQIYVVKYNPDFETDVQDVFIKNLEIKNDTLTIENEKGYVYSLDLSTLKIKTLKGKNIVRTHP